LYDIEAELIVEHARSAAVAMCGVIVG